MAKRNTISGLSINSSYIAIATADLDDGVILNMSLQPLVTDIEDSWDRIGDGLDTLFENLKLKGENICVSLPAEFAIVKVFEADPLEDDYGEFLSWELSQQIVGSIEDYVFDYERLNIPGEGESNKFFVTAYRKSDVDKVSKLLKSKKQHPVVVEPDAFSLINIYDMNYKEEISDPTLIIFSESESTKTILTKDGHYIDMRNATVTEEEPFNDTVKSQCEHILKTNKGFVEGTSLKVLLSGDYFSEVENVNAVKEIYPEAEILSPFKKVKNLSGWSEEDLQKYVPRLSLAVGLAMRDTELL